MAEIYQIGSGMIGQAMALDLAESHKIHLADLKIENVRKEIKEHPAIITYNLDVLDKQKLSSFIEKADIVLLAVPGYLGYSALETIISSGKDVVDISFSPENIMKLNDIAIQNNVTAIFDAGVAPGLPNYIFGYHDSFEDVKSFKYYVGGLPKFPKQPFNYKAPFSPIDVIEEYTRPARMIINKKLITKPALSGIENINFKDSLMLEAFNTDGLRSLLDTMSHVKYMSEKTLRYPGHVELIKSYIKKGTLQNNETIKKLFKEWKLEPGEIEFTLLRVELQTNDKTINYELYDEYDKENNITSMARTTGYTATASINLILENLFTKKGVFPPENLSNNKKIFNFILKYLSKRKVFLNKYI
tara:strand:+ start:1914 stop:2990 length:1077 start_codon:yes stop_codon:yes gene_type:complete